MLNIHPNLLKTLNQDTVHTGRFLATASCSICDFKQVMMLDVGVVIDSYLCDDCTTEDGSVLRLGI